MGKKKTTQTKTRAKSRKKKPAAKSRVVKVQQQVAAHFDVSLKTVQAWRLRGMPGMPGRYDLDEIGQWKKDTIRPASHSDEEQKEKYAGVNDARKHLLEAQADKARADANMAARQDVLEEGSFASLDDLNLFLGEFFTEFRQLLNRMNVDMAAGYSPKLRKQIREELKERHDLVLQQMHDWTLRTEDLEIQAKGKRK